MSTKGKRIAQAKGLSNPLAHAQTIANNQKAMEDIPLIGSIFGNTKEEDRLAREGIDKTVGAFEGIQVPNAAPILPSWLGDYTPQQSTYQDMGPSAFEGIATDPRLKDQQMAALASLQGIVDRGGMSVADEANLNMIKSQAAQADKGRRDAILQNMQQRGMSGSGLELLSQLQSNQAATDRQAQQGLDVAGMAQQRALQAMQQSGQLAGGMRDQDFGEQARIAQAKDAISQFNAGNRLQNSQFNVGQANQAGMFNTQGKQNVANQGVDIRNQAPQQNFQNQMAKAGGIGSAYGAQSNYYTNLGDRKEREKAAVLGAAVKGGAAAYGA